MVKAEPTGARMEQTMVTMKEFFADRGIELNYDAAFAAGLLLMEMDENAKLKKQAQKNYNTALEDVLASVKFLKGQTVNSEAKIALRRVELVVGQLWEGKLDE